MESKCLIVFTFFFLSADSKPVDEDYSPLPFSNLESISEDMIPIDEDNSPTSTGGLETLLEEREGDTSIIPTSTSNEGINSEIGFDYKMLSEVESTTTDGAPNTYTTLSNTLETIDSNQELNELEPDFEQTSNNDISLETTITDISLENAINENLSKGESNIDVQCQLLDYSVSELIYYLGKEQTNGDFFDLDTFVDMYVQALFRCSISNVNSSNLLDLSSGFIDVMKNFEN